VQAAFTVRAVVRLAGRRAALIGWNGYNAVPGAENDRFRRPGAGRFDWHERRPGQGDNPEPRDERLPADRADHAAGVVAPAWRAEKDGRALGVCNALCARVLGGEPTGIEEASA